MKNYVKVIGIALLTAAMVFTFAGCPSGGGGGGTPPNTQPKKLTITDVPDDVYDDYVLWLYVYPTGNTDDPVAVADDWNKTGSTVTVNLYDIADDNKWTGNGTFDIVVFVSDEDDNPLGAAFVTKAITTQTTTIAWSEFEEL